MTTAEKGRGRPATHPSGAYKYTSIALTPEDIELVSEWAWRLRKPRAVLMRELVEKGLQPYRDSLSAKKKYPLPPAAPDPVTPRLAEGDE